MRFVFPILALLACNSNPATQAGDPATSPSEPTSDGTPPGTTTDGSTTDGSTPTAQHDDAVIVSADVPTTLDCGATDVMRFTVKNTGTSEWSEAESVRFGITGTEDALFDGERLLLEDGEVVASGATRTFTVPITAPSVAQTVDTEWQMVRELVHYFGEPSTHQIEVVCDGGLDSATEPTDTSAVDTSAHDTSDSASTDTGLTPPVCVGETVLGPFTATEADPHWLIPTVAVPGTVYKTLTIDFDVVPHFGGEECYNTYFSPPPLVPIYRKMLTVLNGDHWCEAGYLFNVNLQGPGRDTVNVDSWETDEGRIPDGGCNEFTLHRVFSGAPHSLTHGAESHVRVDVDMGPRTLDLDIDGTMNSGVIPGSYELTGDTTRPLSLMFSYDKWVHCSDSNGVEQGPDNEQCCWPPSIDWEYSSVQYELCE